MLLFTIIVVALCYSIGLYLIDLVRFKDISPNKSVLITGGSQGLGKSLALLFASKGCRVVVWDINDSLFPQIQSESNGKILTVKCDITSIESIRKALQQSLSLVPKIDVLINNAGVVSNYKFAEMPIDRMTRTITVNVLAHTYVTKELFNICDHFVVIASVVSKNSFENSSDYCGSKHAIDGIFESVRLELKRSKSSKKVTIVYPYHIKTKMFEGFRSKKMPFRSLGVEEAALSVYRGVCLGKEEVFIPSYIWIPGCLLMLLPSKIRDAVTLFVSKGSFDNVEKR